MHAGHSAHGVVSNLAVGAFVAALTGTTSLAIPLDVVSGAHRVLWALPVAFASGFAASAAASLWKKVSERWERKK
jgi:hypothetical protein